MTRSFAVLALLLACAERNEVIATVDVAAGGAAGSGGHGGVLLVPTGSQPLACGEGADLALGDVDGDGQHDALVAAGCLGVHRGMGDGALGGGTSVFPTFGVTMAVDRIDGDNTLDALGFDDHVRVLLGDGTGVFHHVGDVNAVGPGSLALGDVAAGAELDLVTGSNHQLEVWLGDGAGNFSGPHAAPLLHPIDSHTLGRFGGSAHLDVLAAAGGVMLLLSAGDGMLHAAQPIGVDAPAQVRSVLTADLDGDGCDDAIAFDGNRSAPAPAGGLLRTLMGDCDGQLAQHAALPLARAVDVAAADVDGDGSLDVVAALAAPDGAVAIMRGVGGGALEAATLVALEVDPRALAIGDLDEDGRADVAVLGSAELFVLRNETPVK